MAWEQEKRRKRKKNGGMKRNLFIRSITVVSIYANCEFAFKDSSNPSINITFPNPEAHSSSETSRNK